MSTETRYVNLDFQRECLKTRELVTDKLFYLFEYDLNKYLNILVTFRRAITIFFVLYNFSTIPPVVRYQLRNLVSAKDLKKQQMAVEKRVIESSSFPIISYLIKKIV